MVSTNTRRARRPTTRTEDALVCNASLAAATTESVEMLYFVTGPLRLKVLFRKLRRTKIMFLDRKVTGSDYAGANLSERVSKILGWYNSPEVNEFEWDLISIYSYDLTLKNESQNFQEYYLCS